MLSPLGMVPGPLMKALKVTLSPRATGFGVAVTTGTAAPVHDPGTPAGTKLTQPTGLVGIAGAADAMFPTSLL